jgi:hypothetical protein
LAFASARGDGVRKLTVDPGNSQAKDRGGADKLLLRDGLKGLLMNFEDEVPALLPGSTAAEAGGGSRTNSGSVSNVSGSLACSTVSGMPSRMNSGRVSNASGLRVLELSEAIDDDL